MSVNNPTYAVKNVFLIIIFIASIFLSVLSPSCTVFIIIALLFLVNFHGNSSYYGLFLLLLTLWLVFNAIDVISFKNFVYASDDFSSYYNNYLDFLKFGFNKDSLFEYGNIEIALPLLNYLCSLIIDGPEPYKVKFIYAFIQGFGVLFCCFRISSYYHMNLKRTVLLVSLVLIFYKPIVALQLSRQTFSSIFIVAFIFTNRRLHKIIYFIIAILFHSSTIILLPISIFLFRNRTKKDFVITLIIISCLFALTQITYSVLRLSVINVPILNKLDYIVRALSDPDKIRQSVLTSFLLICYLVPILIGCIVKKWSGNLKYNILIILSLLIIFCMFPGFNNRILLPELYLFLGFYYFNILFDNVGNTVVFYKVIVVVCFSFLFIQSHYNEENRRFSNFELQPLYYLNFFSQQEDTINRDELE